MLGLKIVGAALFVVALGVAGNGDFEDALATEQAYIERVCSNVHSDYQSLGVVCGD